MVARTDALLDGTDFTGCGKVKFVSGDRFSDAGTGNLTRYR
jgi:hypothetical protein